MAKITSVRTKVKKDGSVLGIFHIEGSEQPIFLTGKQVKAACGIDKNLHLLKDGSIEVEYYAVGDKLVGGAECTKENSVVKEFTLEAPKQLSMMLMGATAGMAMFTM